MDYGYYIVVLTAIVIAIPISATKNKELQDKFTNIRPYTWGYFFGTVNIIGGILTIVLIINAK